MERDPTESGEECWRVRARLWPRDALAGNGPFDIGPADSGPGDRADDEDAARAHLGDCAECREWFRRDRVLGRRIRGAGLEARAPESLRARLDAILEEDRAARPAPVAGVPGTRGARVDRGLERPGVGGSWVAGWRGMAAAAVLVLTLAAGIAEQRASAASPAGALTAAMATDYVQRVEDEVRLSVTDPEAIRRFFAEHYGTPLDPRVDPGAEIQGAMICWLRKRATAMVMYRIEGVPVAHYRTRLAEGEGERPLRTESRAGIPLARWTSAGELHALVGGLPSGQLSRLARERFGAGGG